jgi:hypothetical protein
MYRMGTAALGDFAELDGIKEEKLNATKTRALVSVGTYWIPDWVHSAVFQTAAGTAGTVGIDKTIGILQIQPTIGTASRHNHDDVSGSGAKKLRESR